MSLLEQISDTTYMYNQTPVFQEWKELYMIIILALTGSSSQMLITQQIQSLCTKPCMS